MDPRGVLTRVLLAIEPACDSQAVCYQQQRMLLQQGRWRALHRVGACHGARKDHCDAVSRGFASGKSAKPAVLGRVRGTRDLVGDEMEAQARVVQTLQQVVRRYGCKQVH